MKVYQLTNIKTWNEATHQVKEQMLGLKATQPEEGSLSIAGLQDVMISDVDKLVELIFHSKDKQDEKTYENIFLGIATDALTGYAYESKISIQEAGKQVMLTVIGKQRMYGHGNIARFGIPGIAIRLNDKLERLKNLKKHDGPVLFEPLQDTWLDICGYSVIAVMWINGWFMLDLAEELF